MTKLKFSSLTFLLSLFFVTGLAISGLGQETKKDEHHDHPVSGKKIPSPGPEDAGKFIKVDKDAKKVFIPVTATYNDANYGMNFNGHFKGSALYTVPMGWEITIHFKNASPVPHSAVVVERFMTRKLQVGEPYFVGASTQDPLKGLVKDEKFTFVTDDVGEFAIACGFPSHSAGGHWIGLNITKDGDNASVKFKKQP
jgi:hypothetical protein